MKQTFFLTPQMLKSIIELSKAADTDRTSAILAGVCVRIRAKSLSIVATDGKLLVEHKYECEFEMHLGMSDWLDIIVRISDKPTMAIIKALSLLKCEGIDASTENGTLELNGSKIATIEGNYPKYENCFETDYKNYMPPRNEAFRFGWDAKYMALLDKALSLSRLSHGIIIFPQGPGKGVIIEPLNETHIAKITALLMPITIPDER